MKTSLQCRLDGGLLLQLTMEASSSLSPMEGKVNVEFQFYARTHGEDREVLRTQVSHHDTREDPTVLARRLLNFMGYLPFTARVSQLADMLRSSMEEPLASLRAEADQKYAETQARREHPVVHADGVNQVQVKATGRDIEAALFHGKGRTGWITLASFETGLSAGLLDEVFLPHPTT